MCVFQPFLSPKLGCLVDNGAGSGSFLFVCAPLLICPFCVDKLGCFMMLANCNATAEFVMILWHPFLDLNENPINFFGSDSKLDSTNSRINVL